MTINKCPKYVWAVVEAGTNEVFWNSNGERNTPIFIYLTREEARSKVTEIIIRSYFKAKVQKLKVCFGPDTKFHLKAV